jgi:hypothetical protein
MVVLKKKPKSQIQVYQEKAFKHSHHVAEIVRLPQEANEAWDGAGKYNHCVLSFLHGDEQEG